MNEISNVAASSRPALHAINPQENLNALNIQKFKQALAAQNAALLPMNSAARAVDINPILGTIIAASRKIAAAEKSTIEALSEEGSGALIDTATDLIKAKMLLEFSLEVRNKFVESFNKVVFETSV